VAVVINFESMMFSYCNVCCHFVLQEIEWFLDSRHLCRLHIGNEVSRLKHLYSLLTTSSELNVLITECQGLCNDYFVHQVAESHSDLLCSYIVTVLCACNKHCSYQRKSSPSSRNSMQRATVQSELMVTQAAGSGW